jgi:hypothetical protein
MGCCSGHTCDYCAACRLGLCSGDRGGGDGVSPNAKPIGEPRGRSTPTEAPTMPVRTPARVD